MLAARYETIVAEDLNVAAMTRNRRLARAVSDQGFGAARQDRDRRPATGGCGMSAPEHSTATVSCYCRSPRSGGRRRAGVCPESEPVNPKFTVPPLAPIVAL